MDDGRLPPEEQSFREVRRRPAALDGEIDIETPRLRWLRDAVKRGATPTLAVALVASLSFALASIPQPTEQRIEQRLAEVAPAAIPPRPDLARVASDDADERAPRRKRAPRKKHKRVVIAGSEERSETSVNLSGGVDEAPTESRVQPKKKAQDRSKKEEPSLPEATLLFRRLYKDRNGDHFHSVYADKIAAKEELGYRVRESVGYLYENQVRGTTLFTIGEGTMGWIYTDDQGKETIPLYRLVGPDHHDNEVVFTSSQDVKTYWIGNGWREDRVVGYVVKP